MKTGSRCLCARALMIACAFAATVRPAVAHEERGLSALAVLDDVSPRISGVDVRIVHSVAPVLVVRNRTAEPFVLFGEHGEPFLRLQSGTVQANLRSPTTYRALDPTNERPLPAIADHTERPRWTTVSDKSSWAWFDPRIRVSESVASGWAVPGRVGKQHTVIRGHFESLENHGHFVTVLDSVSPQPQGLEIRLLEGTIPAIFVRNTTGRMLGISGLHGEPLVRIGPRGVSANVRSPTYYIARGQSGGDITRRASPDAEPVWRSVSPEPIWSFLEYRARVPQWNQYRTTLGLQRETVLRWSTPATLGGDVIEITGHVEWVPARPLHEDEDSTGSWRWSEVTGSGLAAAALLVVAWRWITARSRVTH